MKITKKYAAASLIGLGLATLTGVGAVSAAQYPTGIDREEARAERQERMEVRLANAVANGKITQEEANGKLARMAERKASREAVHTAVENNDYAAWSAAVGDRPIGEKITEANFSKLVEAHNLREAGDHEGARAIMQEFGFEKGKHGGRGGCFGGLHGFKNR